MKFLSSLSKIQNLKTKISLFPIRSYLSSNSFDKPTTLPVSQPPLSIPAVEPAGHVGVDTSTIERATARTDQNRSVSLPNTTSDSATGDNPPQDNSTNIILLLQPRSAAILGISTTMLITPPKSEPNIHLYNAYMISLYLGLLTSAGSLYKVAESTAWLQKQAMEISIVSALSSVTLRAFSELSSTHGMNSYDWLLDLVVLGVASSCFFCGWMKAKNSTQAASPGLTPASEV